MARDSSSIRSEPKTGKARIGLIGALIAGLVGLVGGTAFLVNSSQHQVPGGPPPTSNNMSIGSQTPSTEPSPPPTKPIAPPTDKGPKTTKPKPPPFDPGM